MPPQLFKLSHDPGKIISNLLSMEFGIYEPISALCAFLLRHSGSETELNERFEVLFRAVAKKNEEYSNTSIAFREIHYQPILDVLRHYEQIDLLDRQLCSDFAISLQLVFAPMSASRTSRSVVVASLRPMLRAACRTVAVHFLRHGTDAPRGRKATRKAFKQVRQTLDTIIANLDIINPGGIGQEAAQSLIADIDCAIDDVRDGSDEDKSSVGFIDPEVRTVLLGSAKPAVKPTNYIACLHDRHSHSSKKKAHSNTVKYSEEY